MVLVRFTQGEVSSGNDAVMPPRDIWINPEHIVAITPAPDGEGSLVKTLNGNYLVTATVAEAVQIYRGLL